LATAEKVEEYGAIARLDTEFSVKALMAEAWREVAGPVMGFVDIAARLLGFEGLLMSGEEWKARLGAQGMAY